MQGAGLNFNLKSSCQRLTSHLETLGARQFARGLLASTPAIISVTDLSRSFHPAQGAKVSVVVVDFESHRMATGSGYQASTRSFGSRLLLPLKFTETIGLRAAGRLPKLQCLASAQECLTPRNRRTEKNQKMEIPIELRFYND